MKYLSDKPMFFGPPRQKVSVFECKHEHGKVFNGFAWRCKDCNRKLEG